MEKPQIINVLIVDDEPAAHARLEDLLHEEHDIQIIKQVRTGREAVHAIEHLSPDLVFLDVQMPGMTGLDVVQKIGPDQMPLVVFVTAYDQYALKAFDMAAIDYLLKPFDDERFEQTLNRARKVIKHKRLYDLQDRLTSLIEQLKRPQEERKSSTDYLERIAVEMRSQIHIVPVHDIDFITAKGTYVELHAGDKTYLVNEQMQSLEERLDPKDFFRIHRSAIVRLDRIDTLQVSAGGDYTACLIGGGRLKISRRRWKNLVQQLGVSVQTS